MNGTVVDAVVVVDDNLLFVSLLALGMKSRELPTVANRNKSDKENSVKAERETGV